MFLYRHAGDCRLCGAIRRDDVCSAATFNIADPQLGIHLMSAELMAYQAVASQDVTPYFYIHKFTSGVRSRVPRELRDYGGMAPRLTATRSSLHCGVGIAYSGPGSGELGIFRFQR